MFRECSFYGWNRVVGSADFTRAILPIWKPQVLPRCSLSRFTSSWYYQFRSGQPHLRLFRSKWTRCDGKCRFGCDEEESIDHILLDCRHLYRERAVVRRRCTREGWDFSVGVLLTQVELKVSVERLLDTVMRH